MGDFNLHAEIKRVERLNIYEAMEQALRDCGSKVPFVMHRKNKKQWLITINASDLIRFAKAIVENEY